MYGVFPTSGNHCGPVKRMKVYSGIIFSQAPSLPVIPGGYCLGRIIAARMYVINEHIIPAISNSIKVIFIHLIPRNLHTEYTEDQEALNVFLFLFCEKVQLFSHLTL